MKQKKETLAFNCSRHQAHLIRRYAHSIMCAELDFKEEVHRRASSSYALELQKRAAASLQQQAMNPLAQQQGAPSGGLAALFGGMGRLF